MYAPFILNKCQGFVCLMQSHSSGGRSRPYRWLLMGWICVVMIVTTYPWTRMVPSIQWHRINWIPFHGVPILFGDIFLNVLLFMPIGFFLVCTWRDANETRGLALVIVSSFGLSLGVEVIQGFSLVRFPSVTDVICNVVGGAGGGLAGVWWGRRTHLPRVPYHEGIAWPVSRHNRQSLKERR